MSDDYIEFVVSKRVAFINKIVGFLVLIIGLPLLGIGVFLLFTNNQIKLLDLVLLATGILIFGSLIFLSF